MKKRDRTGRCSRGICATVWSPLSPLATSATRRTAVRKRQGLKTAAKHTYVELGGPERGQGRLRQTSVCVCVCVRACVCARACVRSAAQRQCRDTAQVMFVVTGVYHHE